MVSANVPENKREKLLDFAANKNSAMSADLSNFQYVNFATHGFINNENPELSGIAFSMINENGADTDGFLRVGDIYNLNFWSTLHFARRISLKSIRVKGKS